MGGPNSDLSTPAADVVTHYFLYTRYVGLQRLGGESLHYHLPAQVVRVAGTVCQGCLAQDQSRARGPLRRHQSSVALQDLGHVLRASDPDGGLTQEVRLVNLAIGLGPLIEKF